MDILKVLIIGGLIVVFSPFFALFNILVTMVRAGGNASKLSANIFNGKSERTGNVSGQTSELSTAGIEAEYSIKRWRTAAGILFPLLMLFLLVSVRQAPLSGFFSWALLLVIFRALLMKGGIHYFFWLLLSATIIVMIVLWKKEDKYFRK